MSGSGSNESDGGTRSMYKVFKRIENGELVRVESCDALENAVNLVERLNITWPGRYVVQVADGNEIELTD